MSSPNKNKTIWNKKLHSDLFVNIPEINIDNAFINNITKNQTDDNIDEKMQDLKNKKKILKNVYKTPPSSNFEQIKQIIKEPYTEEPFSIEDTKNNIFKKMDLFNQDMYYYSTLPYTSLDYFLSNYICKPYFDNINKINDKLKIVKSNEQSNENKENEIKILKIVIYSILSFVISIFVMYNWYHLTVFRHELSKDIIKKTQLKEFDFTIKVENKILKEILDFFFLYSLEPVRFINDFLLNVDKFPMYFNQIPSHNIKRWLILSFAFLFVYYCNIFTIFEAIFSSNTITNISFLAIILLFVNAPIFILFFTQIYKLFNETIELTQSPNPQEYITLIIDQLRSLFIPFFVKVAKNIIISFIKFIIAVFSVKIATIILILYLWLNSIFGIGIYNTEDKDFSWSNEFKSFICIGVSEVDIACNNEIKQISNPCYEEWWEKLLKLIVLTLNENTYFIKLFFILMSIISTLLLIQNEPVQYISILLIITFICLVLFNVLFKFCNIVKTTFF